MVVVVSLIGVALAVVALALSIRDHFSMSSEIIRLRRESAESRARLQHLGRMTTEVAHELKNPVTAVVCAAETLDVLLADQVEEHHRDTLRYIKEYGEHVLTIMGDFIDVSRGVCGVYISHKEQVLLDETAMAVIGLLSPTAGRRGVAIDYDPEESGLYVLADKKHLKQILFNLVHNAIKFAREGGNVWLSVNRATSGEQVILCVRDDGDGMPESVVEHVRSGSIAGLNEDAHSGSGSGIGLLLTSGLINLEGGRWDIISTPGKGTVVAVSFEGGLSLKHSTQDETPAELEQPFRGQSVLLVDGDRGTREAVRQLIEALGGVVDGVGEATQAVEAMKNREYSAVLIDEDLSPGTTNELVKLLKSEPKGHAAKIVVASKQPHIGEHSTDADSIVEKPLSKRALLTSLLPSH